MEAIATRVEAIAHRNCKKLRLHEVEFHGFSSQNPNKKLRTAGSWPYYERSVHTLRTGLLTSLRLLLRTEVTCWSFTVGLVRYSRQDCCLGSARTELSALQIPPSQTAENTRLPAHYTAHIDTQKTWCPWMAPPFLRGCRNSCRLPFSGRHPRTPCVLCF